MKKTKTFLKKLAVRICVLTVVSSLLAGGVVKIGLMLEDLVPIYQVAGINAVRADAVEMPLRLWVLNQVYAAGLNPDEADCIINRESKWREDAIGSTQDYGIWQINIIHRKEIAVKDMLDYQASTKWAINKRLKNGNWNIWTAWQYCR